MVQQSLRQVAAFLFLLTATALHPQSLPPALWFDTAGGDAWTFQKTVSGHTAGHDCQAVTISSPRGSTEALLQGRAFVATVALQSGPNTLVAHCWRGRELASSPVQLWTVRLRDGPHAAIRTQASGNRVALDAGASTASQATPAPLAEYEWRERPGNPAPLRLGSGSDPARTVGGQHIEFTVPNKDGRYYVSMRATDTLHRSDESTAVFRVCRGTASTIDTDREHPTWVDTAVLYGTSPSLVGGDFTHITRRLDGIARLGATAVWISPVTQAPPGDFGYAVTDPFAIRPALGSEGEFRSLLAAAHANGLRVLLDVVTNQFADQHPYFADARQRGRQSPYYAWFQRDTRGDPVHYFDWTHLENLNYDNPEVRNYTTAALAHWVRDYAVDGLRVDAAWALRERAPEFWPKVRQELERINPGILLLAEAPAPDPYYEEHGFDATYDWTRTPGQWAWTGVFGPPGSVANLRLLRAALASDACGCDGAPVLRFLDNNDTGERFLKAHGAQQTRAAVALMLTLPGIPLIYAGEEVGADYLPYAQGATIDWDDPHGWSAFFARLVALRRAVPALHSRQLRLLQTDHEEAVLAYERADTGGASDCPDEGERDAAVVVLNFTAAPVQVRLARLRARPRWNATNLITGETGQTHGDTLQLSPYGAVLLR